MLRAFRSLHAETQGGDTLLRGTVADQAALHGVLAEVEAFASSSGTTRSADGSRATTPGSSTSAEAGDTRFRKSATLNES
jgi:hypothetical protein